MHRQSVAIIILLFVFQSMVTTAVAQERIVVEGTVFNAESGAPIPFASVRIEGTGRSALANADGEYRLRLGPGEDRLKFSHIAFYSERLTIAGSDSLVHRDVFLVPAMVEVQGITVSSRAYDPAQRIIVEAIKRKEDILAAIHDYRYEAYVKLLVTDLSPADSGKVFLITESQTTACWEQPDKYKEVITSRRQSANIPAEGNLVTVGEILNFNANRINIQRYSLVTPTADDALDHYNYYLLDTVYIDSLTVFRLEVEPKNPEDPLFAGVISIADSTYDVVEVDVTFSRGVDLPLVSDARYAQRFAQFDNEYWMPIEIRFSCDVNIEMPIPGVPDRLRVSHTALLHDFHFDTGHPRGTFGEYAIEVDDKADDFDSLRWYERPTIPLTPVEINGYARIDSVTGAPRSLGRKMLTGLAAAMYLATAGEKDFFRFNRVEGPYLGLGLDLDRLVDRMNFRIKTGYAFEIKRGEHQYGLTYRLHEGRKLDVGFDYFNRVTHRPTIVSARDYNPSFFALWVGEDPFDYYLTKGAQAFVQTKLIDFTRLGLTYSDLRHRSLPFGTDFSVFGDEDDIRDNPSVTEGTLRSLTLSFVFDSRQLFRNKGRDERIDQVQYSRLEAAVEYASPDFIDNDFDFRRYWVRFYRRQRSLGLGVTALNVFAGGSDGDLPPQRYFSVDFGDGYFFDARGFSSLDTKNFGGSRVLALGLFHNFRRRLFTASGLPLIRDIPLWLSVYAGVFWTDFNNHAVHPGDEFINTASKAYREVGFGLGNLTPFISPLNFALYFTWQLSDYDTQDFSVRLGFEL